MGAIGGMLGLSGGAAGTGFSAPHSANLITPTSTADLENSGNYSSQTMTAQQNLLAQLQGQGGIGNQNQIYGQLQGIANGQGPNPAQAQYKQNVQQLAAQNAGQIASIKGLSPATQAALMAQQQSGAMQNAAAAGATNLANQQLGALNTAGNLANTQAANQIGQTNANTGAAQAQQGMYQQAASNFNNSQVSMANGMNAANAGLASKGMEGQQGMIGGALNGAAALLADGGEVGAAFSSDGPRSKFGQFLKGATANATSQSADTAQAPATGAAALQQGSSNLVQGLGRAFSRPGASPMMAGADTGASAAMLAANGGMTHDYRIGGNVQAKNSKEKAVKSGNSYANDKIPAVLSEGEVVIPRSVMQSKNPPAEAMKFVQAVMSKRGKK